jgi:C4-type Zn-finger protein
MIPRGTTSARIWCPNCKGAAEEDCFLHQESQEILGVRVTVNLTFCNYCGYKHSFVLITGADEVERMKQ